MTKTSGTIKYQFPSIKFQIRQLANETLWKGEEQRTGFAPFTHTNFLLSSTNQIGRTDQRDRQEQCYDHCHDNPATEQTNDLRDHPSPHLLAVVIQSDQRRPDEWFERNDGQGHKQNLVHRHTSLFDSLHNGPRELFTSRGIADSPHVCLIVEVAKLQQNPLSDTVPGGEDKKPTHAEFLVAVGNDRVVHPEATGVVKAVRQTQN